MNSFIIKMGGIQSKITVDTAVKDWSKHIESEVRAVVTNCDIHNSIIVGDKVLFSERQTLAPIRAEIRKKHTTYRPYTRDEKILGLDRNADGSVRESCEVLDWKNANKEIKAVEERTIEDVVKALVDALDTPYLERADDPIITTKRISASGGALKVSLTAECNALGLGVGDYVEISIRRVLRTE